MASNLRKKFLPFGDLKPDSSEFDVSVLERAVNVLPVFQNYRPLARFRQLSKAPDTEEYGPPTGGIVHRTTENQTVDIIQPIDSEDVTSEPVDVDDGLDLAEIAIELGALFVAAADQGVTEVGGKVSQWNDLSGNGNHLVQATDADRPAKHGTFTFPSGHPIVAGDNTVFMDFTTPLTLRPRACTVFVAAATVSTWDRLSWLVRRHGFSNFFNAFGYDRFDSPDEMACGFYQPDLGGSDSAALATGGADIADETAFVCEYHHVPNIYESRVSIAVNGGSVAEGNAIGMFQPIPFDRFGPDPDPGSGFNFDCGAIVVFNKRLTTAESNRMREAIAQWAGIEGSMGTPTFTGFFSSNINSKLSSFIFSGAKAQIFLGGDGKHFGTGDLTQGVPPNMRRWYDLGEHWRWGTGGFSERYAWLLADNAGGATAPQNVGSALPSGKDGIAMNDVGLSVETNGGSAMDTSAILGGSVYVIVRLDELGIDEEWHVWGESTYTDTQSFGRLVKNVGDGKYYVQWRNDAGVWVDVGTGMAVDGSTYVIGWEWDVDADELRVQVNGDVTTVDGGTFPEAPDTIRYVGRSASASGRTNNVVGGFVTVDRPLTADQRTKLLDLLEEYSGVTL